MERKFPVIQCIPQEVVLFSGYCGNCCSTGHCGNCRKLKPELSTKRAPYVLEVFGSDLLLTVHHKCHVFFIISCWVVCYTSILCSICSVYSTERQEYCFPPWTFHYSTSDPSYFWVWCPKCCTVDLHWGSFIVTCLYWWQAYLWGHYERKNK